MKQETADITKTHSNSFSRQKFRFDMATQVLIVINYILLAITASPHINQFLINVLHIEIGLYWLIAILIFCALFGVWLIGWWLDNKVKYWESIVTEQNIRNPHVMRMIENTEVARAILEKEKR